MRDLIPFINSYVLRKNMRARTRGPGIRHFVLVVALAMPLLTFQSSLFGQMSNDLAEATPEKQGLRTSGLLRQFNDSMVSLTRQVSPAVVEITVTGYGPVPSTSKTNDVAQFARQHDIGSGVILDSDGYIMTNEHVVDGAQRIRVALNVPESGVPFDTAAASARRVLDAKLVGVDKDTDLALLKVDAHNLPALALANSRPVHTGEVVLAIGSPQGLQGSVTMGVVSSVSRQTKSSDATAYIQTDAPINPGNSGGPLVDIDGYVVGLNTMIMSESGGSEGLGFAIPARTVQFVYQNLRKYGHVQRTEIEATAQEITPYLAGGLGLSQDFGVILADITPKGPADTAGLKIGDVIYSVDGQRIAGLPDFATALYLHAADQPLRIDVLRGSQKVSLVVPAKQHQPESGDLADFIDPQNLSGHLGVFVHDFDDKIRGALPDARIASGVVVVAQSPALNSYTSSLRAGDILHSVNQTPIESVHQLRSTLHTMKTGQPVVLQIERAGKLQYVAFDWGD
jgi:serine protease Do